MRKHILFYYTSNKRSISLMTIMRQLVNNGYKVSLLTQMPSGLLHEDAKKAGISTQGCDNQLTLLKKIIYFVKYCKENKVDAVFSHLQQANIVAVLGQFSLKCRVFVFRHHDYAVSLKERIADKIINKLSYRIIVPSSGVMNLMLKNERISKKKINLIHYSYDFSAYPKVDFGLVTELRKRHNASLLLVIMARHIKEKQHEIVFEAVFFMIRNGLDIKLLVLDEGPLTSYLKNWVEKRGLGLSIIFVGYSNNFLSYLSAADLMVHPSLSEASNSAVKESAIVKTPVVVTKGVGDFDDYIVDKKNGFVISNQDKEKRTREIQEILLFAITNKAIIKEYAEKLFQDVRIKFGTSKETIKKYHSLAENGNASF